MKLSSSDIVAKTGLCAMRRDLSFGTSIGRWATNWNEEMRLSETSRCRRDLNTIGSVKVEQLVGFVRRSQFETCPAVSHVSLSIWFQRRTNFSSNGREVK